MYMDTMIYSVVYLCRTMSLYQFWCILFFNFIIIIILCYTCMYVKATGIKIEIYFREITLIFSSLYNLNSEFYFILLFFKWIYQIYVCYNITILKWRWCCTVYFVMSIWFLIFFFIFFAKEIILFLIRMIKDETFGFGKQFFFLFVLFEVFHVISDCFVLLLRRISLIVMSFE